MPIVNFRLPVPKLSFQTVTFSFNLSRPRLPRIQVPRVLWYSAGLHLVLLLFGATLQYIADHGRPISVEVEVSITEVPIEPGSGGTAAGDTIVARGKSGRGGLANLLKQVSAGANAPNAQARTAQVSGARGAGELSRLTDSLRQHLAVGADAFAPSAHAEISGGRLERVASVPLGKGASSSEEKPISVLEKEQIRKAIAASENSFRNCQERALLSDAGVSGQASLLFSVAAAGGVSEADIHFDGKASPAARQVLEQCLRSQALKVVFPAGVAGAQIRFNLLLR